MNGRPELAGQSLHYFFPNLIEPDAHDHRTQPRSIMQDLSPRPFIYVRIIIHKSFDHPDHALYERYFPQGAGSIFTFEIKGGTEEAHRFIDNLKIFSLLANVADVKSLVIHPASTTHSQLTDQEKEEQEIFPGTVRLSIGTEHIDDLIDDLKQALEKV